MKDQSLYDDRQCILPWINEYSPYEQVSRSDPPIALFCNAPPNLGKVEKDPTDSAVFSVKLEELCDSHRGPYEFVYPVALNVKHTTDIDFIKAHLRPDLN
jgi:hypothetical protein